MKNLTPSFVDKNRPEKLLVIRLSAMGDVAMTIPVLKALAEQYPALQVTVLTRGFFKPLFAPLDRIGVLVADVRGKHKGIGGLWKLYRELHDLRFDAVADLHNVLRSNILKRFFALSGPPVYQIDKGRAEKKALTSRRQKVFEPLPTTHERYARVFEALGYPVDLDRVDFLPRQPIADSTRSLMGKDALQWIGIAPFAAFPGKEYPKPLMEEVLARLDDSGKYRLLLFGGPDDQAALSFWTAQFEHCVNLAGKFPFAEELALISNLDLMLSMDSGNAHLAANFGVPVLTLWGLTHPYAGFYPFKQDPANALCSDRQAYPGIPTSVYGNKMPRGYERAMESIRPDAVVDKILDMLEGSKNNPIPRP